MVGKAVITKMPYLGGTIDPSSPPLKNLACGPQSYTAAAPSSLASSGSTPDPPGVPRQVREPPGGAAGGS